jgi:ferritin-like metal-binding protein YciE
MKTREEVQTLHIKIETHINEVYGEIRSLEASLKQIMADHATAITYLTKGNMVAALQALRGQIRESQKHFM